MELSQVSWRVSNYNDAQFISPSTDPHLRGVISMEDVTDSLTPECMVELYRIHLRKFRSRRASSRRNRARRNGAVEQRTCLWRCSHSVLNWYVLQVGGGNHLPTLAICARQCVIFLLPFPRLLFKSQFCFKRLLETHTGAGRVGNMARCRAHATFW